MGTTTLCSITMVRYRNCCVVLSNIALDFWVVSKNLQEINTTLGMPSAALYVCLHCYLSRGNNIASKAELQSNCLLEVEHAGVSRAAVEVIRPLDSY